MDPVSIITGITAGINALVSPWTNKAKADAERRDIQRQRDQLKTSLNNLETNYQHSKLELETTNRQNISNLNRNIGITAALRDSNATFSAMGNVKNSQFAYEDLTSMIAQASQSLGSAIQQSAQTGFRNTGSNTNVQTLTENANRQNLARAQETIKLSSAQQFMQASDSYISASAQMQQYRLNLRDNAENFRLMMTGLENEYEQQKAAINANDEYLEKAYDDAKYEWWEGLLDFVTLGLYGAADTISAVDSGRLNQINTELAEYQLAEYDAL